MSSIDHRYSIEILRCVQDVLRCSQMFSRCSLDVLRIFPGCFQDAPMHYRLSNENQEEKKPVIILGTSREHLENIKRTSIEYLEKIQKHLWSSENICEHLRTSEHILNTSENLYRISVINWGHPEKKCPHRGWLSIKVTTQLKTSENSWEHRKTSKIIWYHPENNWGPIIDNWVQFEEDFNSRTKNS